MSVRTTCPYCGVGCGVLATRAATGVDIAGDPQHPANFGRLCSKGTALGETIGLEGRLLQPVVNGADCSWEHALDTVAQGFLRTIATHGPESVAFYVSGQLLTEDYYVANKLMKGGIGSANIDTNSRLCMSSAVAGHVRAFGEDLVPVSYADLEESDLVVLTGSNTAWCHPILYQRLAAAKEKRPGMKIVVIDPRRTATCEIADLHLPLASGADVWLFNGLLTWLDDHGIVDADFVAWHTHGVADALRAARTSGTLAEIAARCRVDAGALRQFYRWFARSERVVTAFSQGVNQSSAGSDKVNAIINCHLLTGRIGKPDAGPFSITGQPNAMGGREVGGLANMLAAHLDIANPAHRTLLQGFWNSPRIAERPGLKAVDLFEAVHDGRIKALWIMATNPVVSLPDADRVRAALERCPLVVVSDVVARTDTSRYAQVLLPALAWGEKDGTVTNSERRISRSRAFLPAPEAARPDWWIVCEVARRMGYAGFEFEGPAQIFDEHARLSAFRNAADASEAGALRAFNIGGLAGLTAEAFDALEPVRWPCPDPPAAGDTKAEPRLFADRLFFHPDRRARFVATPPRAPANAPDAQFPLVLNTGRIRDQWHTMTRSGRSPRLSAHLPEPYIEMHPHDAMLAGVRDGHLARAVTRHGAMVARLRTSADQGRGAAFVPIHWNDQFASDARVGALVNPVVDPVSGEPEFKHTPLRVEDFPVDWHGFLLTRRAVDPAAVTWWALAQGEQFLRYELAGRGTVADWPARARGLLGDDAGADWLEYADRTAGLYRAARVVDERIEACLFISPRPDLPSRAWLAALFARPRLEELDRVGLLVGEPPDRAADTGPVVCVCHGVGRNTITGAIRAQRLGSVEQVGQCTKAGTNCGSCIPEIRGLLSAVALSEETA